MKRSINSLFNIAHSCQKTRYVSFINNLTRSFVSASQTLSHAYKIRHNKIVNAKVNEEIYSMTAYTTAESYNLEELKSYLSSRKFYVHLPLPEDVYDGICMRNTHEAQSKSKEVFLFRQGCVVFWNSSQDEINEMLKILDRYSKHIYPQSLIEEEEEQMDYVYIEQESNLHGGKICIKNGDQLSESVVLDKYSFSIAFCNSVKLGILEAKLSEFVDTVDPILEDLKNGKKFKLSRHELLKKTGQLYTMRHSINLTSNFLDTPDFFWDRDDLEKLYSRTVLYLNIPTRVKIINEKLNHCCDMTELLRAHLNDRHHLRLEWMIITLIFIEVVFEMAHWFLPAPHKSETWEDEGDKQITNDDSCQSTR